MRAAKIASAGATLAIAASLIAGSPAQAAPLVTGGLVNVTVTDVLNDNTVEVLNDANISVAAAIDLAANVCGLTVGVVAQDLASDGTCTNTINGDTFQVDQRR